MEIDLGQRARELATDVETAVRGRVDLVKNGSNEDVAELLLGSVVVVAAGFMALRRGDPRARALMLTTLRLLAYAGNAR